MMSSSTMAINPADVPEANALRGWYDMNGNSMAFVTFQSGGVPGMSAGGNQNDKSYFMYKGWAIGPRRKGSYCFLYFEGAWLIFSTYKPDYITIAATVTYIKGENISYPACPSEGCSKKVLESQSGWRCEKCDRSYPEPEHRFILTCSVADFSGQTWLQAFNEAGQVLLGKTANEMVEMRVRFFDNGSSH